MFIKADIGYRESSEALSNTPTSNTTTQKTSI